MLKALLTNIRVLAKANAPKATVSKEPYFDRKWGSSSALEKNLDRSAYNTTTASDQASKINDEILVRYKTSTNIDSGRTDFLNKIARESTSFIQEQRARMAQEKREEELCQNSMEVMTEHIFEIIKSYSYELNNALGFGPFHVAATNPQSVTEVVKFNRLRQPEETISYYRARLSTPSFSLILRGDKRGIQFFMMPVARALGLSKQECQFLPILRLSARLEGGEVSWTSDQGRPLTQSMVEIICMNLFQRLIEETKELIERQAQERKDNLDGFDEIYDGSQSKASAS